MRETTSAIWSESASDSLMASPSSFIELLEFLIHDASRVLVRLHFFRCSCAAVGSCRETTRAGVFYIGSLIKSMTMSPLSTGRKLGIAARIAGQQLRRTRTFGAVMRAGRMTAARWGQALGQLWLEVTGFVFLALAAVGGSGLLARVGKTRRTRAAGAGGGIYSFVWLVWSELVLADTEKR